MIRQRTLIRQAARRIGEAVDRTSGALAETSIEQEPAFTDRMLGAIEESMRDFRSRGVVWSAKTLTDRGRNAQEREFGADFAGVLSIDLPGFAVKKGFLAQAKLIESSDRIKKSEFNRMKQQCDDMLKHTPDSYVFIYSRDRVVIVPAVAVISSEPRNPHRFYSRSVTRFYEEHLECFIGDRRLSAPTVGMLDSLRSGLAARSLLYIEAKLG